MCSVTTAGVGVCGHHRFGLRKTFSTPASAPGDLEGYSCVNILIRFISFQA